MNTLYHVRQHSARSGYDVNTLETATHVFEAACVARSRINPDYLDEYHISEVQAVCQTPDVVEGFEPV